MGDTIEEPQNENIKTIMLNIKVFEDELTNIQHKLEKVKKIESVTINHDYNKKYKVMVRTGSNNRTCKRFLFKGSKL